MSTWRKRSRNDRLRFFLLEPLRGAGRAKNLGNSANGVNFVGYVPRHEQWSSDGLRACCSGRTLFAHAGVSGNHGTRTGFPDHGPGLGTLPTTGSRFCADAKRALVNHESTHTKVHPESQETIRVSHAHEDPWGAVHHQAPSSQGSQDLGQVQRSLVLRDR